MMNMNNTTFIQEKDVTWGLWRVYYKGTYIGMVSKRYNGTYTFESKDGTVETTGDSQLLAVNKAEWYLNQQGKSLI